MKVIVVNILKGGAGKTTTSLAIANSLKRKGYKILLIDADKQRNSTGTFLIGEKKKGTLFDYFIGRESLVEIINHTDSGIDVIAADKHLNMAGDWIEDNPAKCLCLRYDLEDMNAITQYDYIIIDTSCTEDTILDTCYLASDMLIVPTDNAIYSLDALSGMKELLNSLNEKYHTDLHMDGILLTRYQSNLAAWADFTKALENHSQEMYGAKVYETKIPNSSIVAKSTQAYSSIFDVGKNSKLCKAYDEFVEKEILK